MFAKVVNNQIVSANVDIGVYDAAARSWNTPQREASGIYEVNYDTSNLKDEEYYINGAETLTFANNKVTASYGVATPKKLDDTNAVNEKGQPVLDQNGKQLVIPGLKSIKKAQVKAQASGLLQSTDWYVIRKAEANTAIPDDVSTYRSAVRATSNDMEAAIDAVNSVEELATLYRYVEGIRPIGEFPRLA